MSRTADLTVTGTVYALLLFAPLFYGSVVGLASGDCRAAGSLRGFDLGYQNDR